MTGKRISRQKLNNAIKALPIPVQEHCKRCKLIAGYLVDLIRLEDWFLDAGLNPDHIVSAVYLHDVGKCAIPRDNLYAEHNETAAKKKVYRSHVEEGVRFVERECDIDFASFGERAFERYVYAAITEHHEQADGCGFPRALRSKAMTVTGKITAIADALDNMLFVGAAEGAQEVGVASAVEALEGMAGRELDRDLVKALTRDKTALCGFLEYIDTRNQNKRKRDAYGLQLSFSPICNIQENRKVDYYVTFVINDPYWGIIRPEVFWPVADHTGQLLRLTKLAVERVCITCDLVADRHGEYSIAEESVIFKTIDGVLYTEDGKTLVLYPSGKQGDVTIPSSVERIGYYAFAGNQYVTSVTFTSNIAILDGAFTNCVALTEIVFEASVSEIQFIGRDTVSGCILTGANKLAIQVSETSHLVVLYDTKLFSLIVKA